MSCKLIENPYKGFTCQCETFGCECTSSFAIVNEKYSDQTPFFLCVNCAEELLKSGNKLIKHCSKNVNLQKGNVKDN